MTPAESKAQFLADNLKPGEIYAGLILGQNGAPDHHLVLLPGETSAAWPKAKAWAKEQGGELPTRREQSLLFANCKDEFKADWYWSGEAYGDGKTYAWYQYFDNGNQGDIHHDNVRRARAVRRLII
jgi:hypothetical protein